MKKFFYVAIAATALASCSSDNLVDLKEGDELKIAAVADNDSRAADVWCNNNLMPSFVLFADAYSTQGTYKTFINAETYTNDGSSSTYSAPDGITRYWPENDKLSFYAISGVDASDINWTAGRAPHTNEITIKQNVREQVDIVYAVQPKVAKTSTGVVTLNFRHALSQVEFMAKNGNPEELEIEILDVRVGNVYSTGELYLPTETSDKNVQNHATDNGEVFVSQQNIWNNNSVSTLDDLTYFDITKDNFGAAVVLDEEAKSLTISTDADTKEEEDATENVTNNSMLLLPQSQTAWDGEKGAYLAVKCNIYNLVTVNGATEKVLLYGDKNDDGVAEGRWAYVPVAINWQPGYKYVYTFNFADGTNAGYEDSDSELPGTNPVLVNLTIDVTVDDFEPAAGEDIEMVAE